KPVRLAGVTGLAANGVEAVLRVGRSYLVHPVGQEDRYGRQPAHLVGDGTRWVQGDLLAQGHALFQSDHALSAVCLAALRRAEKLGESARRGVWADATLTVAAEDIAALRDKRGQYVLVKGKVLSVGDRKRRVYLNFGQKWNQDFTVSLAKSGRRAFKGDLVRVLASKGKTLRVRGVLEWSGGPLIRVLDEGQIELALP
ncbi:MAG: nuclease, partial [Pseudomonadota bacterium]